MIVMKKSILFILSMFSLCICLAQDPYVREFDHDNSGNRVLRTLTIPSRSTGKSGEAAAEAVEKDSAARFEDKIGEFTLIAYPNPTTGALTVDVGNYEKLTRGQLILYSATGRLLREFPMDSPTVSIDISSYSPGTYILTLRMDGRMKDWKIIKE